MTKSPESSSIKTGRKPISPIRWTLDRAAGEFGCDATALSKRLRAESIECDPTDYCFTTSQIVTAMYGDLNRERTRNEAAAADLREMKRDEFRFRLIPATWLRTVLEAVASAVRQVIEHSPLGPTEKVAIFANLRKLGERNFAEELKDAA